MAKRNSRKHQTSVEHEHIPNASTLSTKPFAAQPDEAASFRWDGFQYYLSLGAALALAITVCYLVGFYLPLKFLFLGMHPAGDFISASLKWLPISMLGLAISVGVDPGHSPDIGRKLASNKNYQLYRKAPIWERNMPLFLAAALCMFIAYKYSTVIGFSLGGGMIIIALAHTFFEINGIEDWYSPEWRAFSLGLCCLFYSGVNGYTDAVGRLVDPNLSSVKVEDGEKRGVFVLGTSSGVVLYTPDTSELIYFDRQGSLHVSVPFKPLLLRDTVKEGLASACKSLPMGSEGCLRLLAKADQD